MDDVDRLYTRLGRRTSTHYHRPMSARTFTAPSDVSEILATECAAAGRVLLGLGEDAFGLPTRCPPWDVKALAGHLWRDVDRILVYTAEPAPADADSDAVAYYRSGYDPVADAPDVARRAMEVADRFATGADLVRAFDERWRDAVDVARSLPPERLVRTFGPCLRLDEYLCTRILEAAIHGLDLADALGREPHITPGATTLVRAMLVALLGADPPPALGWDDIAFLETGTGRRAPSATDRRILGPLADRLPLLA
jgi:uncharacterized protein (TIGR03083 family)